MKCLYCGKRLSLLHKLAGREFCGDEHQAQYMQDQESLGLARLIEAKHYAAPPPPSRKKKGASIQSSGPPPLADRFIEQVPKMQNPMRPAFLQGEALGLQIAVSVPPFERLLDSCGISICRPELPAPSVSLESIIHEMEIGSEPTYAPGLAMPGVLPILITPRSIGLAQPVAVPLPGLPAARHSTVLPEPIAANILALSPAIAQCPGSRLVSAPEAAYSAPRFEPERTPVDCSPEPFTAINVGLPEFLAQDPEKAVAATAQALSRMEELTAGPLQVDPGEPVIGPGYRETDAARPVRSRVACEFPKTEGSLRTALASAGLITEFVADGVIGTTATPVAPTAQEQPPKAFLLPPSDLEIAVAPALPRASLVTLPMSRGIADRQRPGASVEPVSLRSGVLRMPVCPSSAPSTALQSSRDCRPIESAPAAAGRRTSFDFGAVPFRLAGATIRVDLKEADAGLNSCLPAQSPGLQALPIGTPTRDGFDWPRSVVEPLSRNSVCDAGGLCLGPDAAPFDLAQTWAPGGTDSERESLNLLPLSANRLIPINTVAISQGDLSFAGEAPRPILPRMVLELAQDDLADEAGSEDAGDPLWKRVWPQMLGRAQSIPSGAKWSALAIPLVIALLVHSLNRPAPVPYQPAPDIPVENASLVEGGISSPLTEETPSNPEPGEGVQAMLAGRWQNFQENITHRAAISLADDFRNGLGSWMGEGDWAGSWSYDDAGFVRPGKLALYTPSVTLTDYQMAFTGQIEKGGLSWVFRAADLNNYYVARLVITQPGPIPEGALIRYAVIGGKRGKRHETPLPFQLRNGKTYRFQLDVRGSNFSIYLDDKLVDYFQDDQLPRGGVGFFLGGGDRVRLRWISVMHQYDALGRLCALLAPYSLDSPPRSY